MESFNDLLVKWQPFFTAVAGVAATLAGLLFVSLSINREKITARENHMLLRLARRSFGDLLFTLFLALMFLIPNSRAHGLATPLFIVAGYRGVMLIVNVCRRAKLNPVEPIGLTALRERAFQAVTTLGTIIVAIGIYQGNIFVTVYLVPVVALLLFNASMNAWTLLVDEKREEIVPAGKG